MCISITRKFLVDQFQVHGAYYTTSILVGFFRQCYEWMLHKAKSMDWSEDSAKALVVIGDAPPHPPSYTDQNINWWDEVELLKGMGVKVNGGHLYIHVRGVIKTFVDWCDKSNTM